MSPDLTPEEHATLERRIDCPVSWCMGSWLEHGGDGAAPERWLHEEEGITELGHGASISRTQEGAGPVEWSFAMDRHNIATAQDKHTLSRMLREVADRIDSV